MFIIGLIVGLFVGAFVGVFAAAFIVGRAEPCRHCGEDVPYKVVPPSEPVVARLVVDTLATEHQRPIA